MILVAVVALIRTVQQIIFVRNLAKLLSRDGHWFTYLVTEMQTVDLRRNYSGFELSLRDGVYKAIFISAITAILCVCILITRRLFLRNRKFWTYISFLEGRAQGEKNPQLQI
jgi:hypothetical protein